MLELSVRNSRYALLQVATCAFGPDNGCMRTDGEPDSDVFSVNARVEHESSGPGQGDAK